MLNTRLMSIALLVVMLTTTSYGQAFCALRDPVRSIKEICPDKPEWKSVVAHVDADVRADVARRLPFTLHVRELGEHTLYIVSESTGRRRLVHARSEASPSGMVEIVWALDGALRVADFRFQRCRSPQAKFFEGSALAARLRRSISSLELRALMTEDGSALTPAAAVQCVGSEELGALVVRSAQKTIVTTELAWGSSLATFMMEECAQDHTPGARLVALPVPTAAVASEAHIVRWEELHLAAVHNPDDQPVGFIAWMSLSTAVERRNVLVRIGPDGAAIEVFNTDGSALGEELTHTLQQRDSRAALALRVACMGM